MPDQVHCTINAWLIKTFAHEWSIVTSGYLSSTVPHGSRDTFKPDPNDPNDPLHNLPLLESPHFLPGVLCAVKSCSHLAYLHPYCAACYRQKFRVEVCWMETEGGGLGLFATSRFEGKGPSFLPDVAQLHKVEDDERILNFCTRVEYIDECECTPFHIHKTHLDHIASEDPYIVKYMYEDLVNRTRIKYDAMKMHFKSHNRPGLARYAVID